MHILIDHWKEYQINGLDDIDEINETTAKYKKDNDPYQEFTKPTFGDSLRSAHFVRIYKIIQIIKLLRTK